MLSCHVVVPSWSNGFSSFETIRIRQNPRNQLFFFPDHDLYFYIRSQIIYEFASRPNSDRPLQWPSGLLHGGSCEESAAAGLLECLAVACQGQCLFSGFQVSKDLSPLNIPKCWSWMSHVRCEKKSTSWVASRKRAPAPCFDWRVA